MELKDIHIGQKVVIQKTVGARACGDYPGFTCAYKGETVVVRKINEGFTYPISVSHEEITDQSFGVTLDELAIKGI